MRKLQISSFFFLAKFFWIHQYEKREPVNKKKRTKLTSTTQVTPEEYKHTIEAINTFFLEAETVDFRTFAEGCVGCLSLFSIFLCYDDKYKKVCGVGISSTTRGLVVGVMRVR